MGREWEVDQFRLRIPMLLIKHFSIKLICEPCMTAVRTINMTDYTDLAQHHDKNKMQGQQIHGLCNRKIAL